MKESKANQASSKVATTAQNESQARYGKARALLLMACFFVAALAWLPPPQPALASGGGEAAPTEVPFVKLEPVVVNLNDDDEVHYLKCSMEFEVGATKDAEAITKQMAVVRNELILLLSSLRTTDLRGEKSKQDLLRKIEQRLNRTLGHERIKHTYFTELVVQ